MDKHTSQFWVCDGWVCDLENIGQDQWHRSHSISQVGNKLDVVSQDVNFLQQTECQLRQVPWESPEDY